MKSLFRPTLAALGIVCLSSIVSCKDYLDVKPTAFDTPADIFSSVSGANSAILGAYDPLSGDPGYGNRISSFFPFDSDEMQSSQGGNDGGTTRRGITRYSAAITNADVQNPWNTLYQGIERANSCIKYIPEMAGYKSGADAATLQRFHGEALTLRAQYFFELVRNWGDVPEPRTPSAAGQDFTVPRADRGAIFDHLIEDLALAENLVPWRSDLAANERITKGAVKALRARIAMYRGGYSLGQDGVVTRPSNYQDYYTIARDECAQLMARRDQHDLNPSYEETFRSINELRPDNKHEIMFEVAMAGGSAASDSKLGYYNGPRMTSSPKYGQSSGAITALPTYFYAFDSLDARRDITLTPYLYANGSDNQSATTLINVTDGKFRRDWRNPLISSVTVQSLGYNWPIIRFADVLLMFAEAQADIASPTTAFNGVTPVQALNEVRLRGFKGNATNAKTASTPTDKAGFFQALQNERFLEFGGEGIRKYDLIRWNLLGTKIAEAKATLRAWVAGTAGTNIPTTAYYRVVNGQLQWARSLYRPAPATAPTGVSSVSWKGSVTEARIADIASGYTVEHQLLPIPAQSVNTNPNLKQNKGYN
ncbi:RagB/SusD family nutrient uptake outer membrane protein [Hymenobacter busanensis]|uniref:RagB/SusD family nutrient uptake outer membrane protein n=1 Tax=Hymenobacter busanensis TaxID=2607656 RepID=A0A7L4ZW23_9BACT|nr:RagB/SusD family nutrient uptake outer membrane protein [Hymenobacter busanensis]KAA9339182.1 RagB/SusD family nutrient uptake outer membrane protein [Hymenobacter busanensis]QHJ07056.1 RagB/SusD family nutrient uptake outer membrane protein [Hymenobacter busanensis]